MNFSDRQKADCRKILATFGEASQRMKMIEELGELVAAAARLTRQSGEQAHEDFLLECADVLVVSQQLWGDTDTRQHTKTAPSTASLMIECALLTGILSKGAIFGPKIFAAEERRSIEKIRAMIDDIAADNKAKSQLAHDVDYKVNRTIQVIAKATGRGLDMSPGGFDARRAKRAQTRFRQ